MTEKGKYHYIGGNEKSILRDGEMYNTKLGIGIYHPEVLHRFEGHKPAPIGEEPLWLPRETSTVIEKLDQDGSVLVTGEPGTGKTTVIYGLRKILRDAEVPYCYHDGHFAATATSRIETSMNWAKKNNGVFIWDSFDYLVATSNRIRRNISRTNAVEKARTLLGRVESQIQDGLKIVATSHNDDWLSNFGDPTLLGEYWSPVVDKMTGHTVTGMFETCDELTAFYELVGPHAGFSKEDAHFFGTLPQHFTDDEARVEEQGLDVRHELSSYRVAKLVCLDVRQEQADLMQSYAAFKRGDAPLDQVKESAKRYVRVQHHRTQKMMGNDYDVQLLKSA